MRKFLAMIIAGVMALGCVFPTGAVSLPFKDVQPTDWFFDAVAYAYGEGVVNGVEPDRFDPKGPMTRGMFVTVLANLAQADTDSFTQQHFVDAAPGKWYTPHIEWAAHYGLAAGTGAFQFKPNDPITREQMVALLYRFAQAAGNDTEAAGEASSFADYDSVSRYAQSAVDWAVEREILAGTAPGTLSPKGTATRAQAAQLLYSARTALVYKAVITTPVSLPLPDEIDKQLYTMTLEEKVGQLFLPRCPGSNAAALTQRLAPAGYTLYARDFQGKTKAQVQAVIESYQAASKVPLFIAVDEEGGTVVRVSSNPQLAAQPFQSPQEIYRAQGLEGLTTDTQAKARLLLSLGVNLNLAPVCDVSTNPRDYMYSRSMGVPAEETATAIGAMVAAMEEGGLSGALKHFPGYGNNLNTHTGISLDKRPLEQFQKEDFLPFSAGIEAGAPSVLVSHNIVSCMDADRPASLSKQVHDILRNDLGFQGVMMTDDLSMDAIKLYTGGKSPAVAAFLAGNDLLLTSDWEQDYKALLAAVKDGTVPLEQVEASVRRLLEWKQAKGLLHPQGDLPIA